MSERFWITIVISITGIALTIARRYKNKDSTAGVGIAGWTIFILFMLWYYRWEV